MPSINWPGSVSKTLIANMIHHQYCAMARLGNIPIKFPKFPKVCVVFVCVCQCHCSKDEEGKGGSGKRQMSRGLIVNKTTNKYTRRRYL